MGYILDNLYGIIEKNASSKNVSILLLGCNNLKNFLNLSTNLLLPFSSLHSIDL
jgi:hypothetical protein